MMRPIKPPETRPSRAFTLVELLTTISIISLLSALLMSAVVTAKRKVHKVGCLNNLRQLGVAGLLYAADDKRQTYANTRSDRDDNQNWLYPAYLTSLKVFSCSSTRNSVRPNVFDTRSSLDTIQLLDLAESAKDTHAFGTSYEVYGFMNYNGTDTTELIVDGTSTNVPGVQKTEATIAGYAHKNTVLGLRGVVPGPARIWLFLDSDPSPGNYPQKTSNHGTGGLNVAFCDGHVEWITRQRWLYSYELSQDEGRMRP